MKPGPTELAPQRMIAALEQIREAADGALEMCQPLHDGIVGHNDPELAAQVCTACAGYARALVVDGLQGLPHTVTLEELLKGKAPAPARPDLRVGG